MVILFLLQKKKDIHSIIEATFLAFAVMPVPISIHNQSTMYISSFFILSF